MRVVLTQAAYAALYEATKHRFLDGYVSSDSKTFTVELDNDLVQRLKALAGKGEELSDTIIRLCQLSRLI